MCYVICMLRVCYASRYVTVTYCTLLFSGGCLVLCVICVMLYVCYVYVVLVVM